MDLRQRELTWARLLALLLWTVLMMIKRGATQVIEMIEVWVFETDVPTPETLNRERSLERTLLPPLDDELVSSRIWPLMHKRVNVSLLWRLRRVNRAWRERVGSSVEWAALEVVRLNSPGYLRLLAERGERRPSMQERVEGEIRMLTILLSERLESFIIQSEELQSREVRRESTQVDRRQHWTKTWASRADSELLKDCVCRERCALYNEGSSDIIESDFNCSEEEREEFEADVSSTESSVYYPRHVIRIR